MQLEVQIYIIKHLYIPVFVLFRLWKLNTRENNTSEMRKQYNHTGLNTSIDAALGGKDEDALKTHKI